MTEKETAANLLERARIEEKSYNFQNAVKLYEIAAKSFLDRNLVEEAASSFKKAGLACSLAIETVKTSEEFIENGKRGIEDYRIAKDLFSRIEMRNEVLECEAESLFIKALMNESVTEIKKAFNDSYDLFIELSKLYYQKGDKERICRALTQALLILVLYIHYCNTQLEIKDVIQKGIKIGEESWKLSNEIGNLQYIGLTIFSDAFINLWQIFTMDFKKNEHFTKYYKKLFLKFERILELTEGWDDSRILGYVFVLGGCAYCAYATHYIEDEIEQGKITDKGLILLEKALNFGKEAKNNFLIIMSIFYLNWWAFFLRRFNYVQKRIVKDVDELLTLGKAYANFHNLLYFYANLLPAFYYANIAQMRMFTSHQRMSYANKGIEHAQESLKGFSSLPFSIWPNLMLTYSFSQLALLTTSKEEQKEYSKNMLYYTHQAKNMGENLEGGVFQSFCYNSLYRAYKTLADITEDKENKIKMLSNAAEASRKYMDYSMEIATSNLTTEMRLGLLYEEISILTGKEESLIQAKELYLNVINESNERRYYYYAAAATECFARIEDRLGRYSASAEYYKKALDYHAESLKSVKYKPRKVKIKEKMDYAKSWILIERAKNHHKIEKHTQAKECYKKACEILQNLPSYNYESIYYSAWILLEEAEDFSKREKHEEAIVAYKETIAAFDDTSETLKEVFKQSKDRLESEKIRKLEKLIKIRMKHCSARVNVEEARMLGRQGDHLAAAEKFASAASEFKEVCNKFKIEKEREELEAGYHLCRAWESMEFAETYGDSNRFAEASELFTKASNLFSSSKMKLLSLGNSAFCQALEYGCKFDEATETGIKAVLYPKVKTILRKAASSYRKGGFENGADWALATSTYFDAAWHLIRADEEMNLDEKGQLLELGSKILESASKLFAKSGYKEKEREILEQLDMVRKEKKILISALNTIKEPKISRSTAGIVAPACPVETSSSLKLSEIRQFTQDEMDIKKKRAHEGLERSDQITPVNVFLSYATTDSSYFGISKIAKEIIKYPEIDNVLYWEADLHDDIYDYMDTNLGNCDIFLLFCSPNALKSDAVKMEWQAALKIKKKIIPVFIREQDIPALLSTKLGVQFTKDDVDGAVKQIYHLILKKLEI